MKFFKAIGLLILGLIMIYFSLKKTKYDKEFDDDLSKNLKDELKFYGATVNFKLLLFGMFSLLIGIIFLLSELELIDISISE
ncbi:hypothetical protein DFQ03_0379 [Maribacter caenipelagi]|uniref:DUF3784 domain-containing protein n=1 Tax=Maribacter caenipelagi TaxID=1447781 RepID=A0A4R7DE89_9FLAO|nr:MULTISPECIES: hypothetical protein [Maribacter]TDS18671.1 hypothetical protein DFQ03_0379 [Maribacter caenipelagi]HAF79372.1 hypothetical protein [Maribacter sp.]HAI37262.1 hypothetical protein [Maribacter sp.]|tara:strand:- start:86696 stop:86941 length:246 start_codon:yes stop_codon:yes gene_type:complete